MRKFSYGLLALVFFVACNSSHSSTETVNSRSENLITPFVNLVVNGEFSTDLLRWNKIGNSGQMSLVVGRNGGGNALQIVDGAWVRQSIPIQGSHNYRLTVWGRLINGNSCIAGLRGGHSKSQVFRQSISFLGAWEVKSFVFTVPTNATWSEVFFEQGNPSTCQFDSVVLEDVPTPVNQTVAYQATTDSFLNPERGYRIGIQLGYSINSTKLDTGWTWNKVRGLDAQGNQTKSVVQAYISLQNFKSGGDLSAYVAQLRPRFDLLRAYHLKAVLRFWYSWSVTFGANGPTNIEPDASMATIRDHIRQLTPLLRDYADVILVVQRGFLGAWGEGVYSTGGAPYSGVNVQPTAAQLQQVATMVMQALPTDRRVQVRYANELKSFISDPSSLSDSTAYSTNSPASRLALNDDCFMLRRNDGGTVQADWTILNVANDTVLLQDRNYLSQVSRYMPIGGEMCQWDLYPTKDELGRYDTTATANTQTNINNTTAELERFHWSWIADDYGPGPAANPNSSGVIQGNWWANWGIRDLFGRRLGYRLSLIQSTAPNIITNDRLQMSFSLTNQGFAAPFNPRLLRLVLRNINTMQEYTYTLAVDPRSWQPGVSQTINVDLPLTVDMRKQTYQVFMHLPDPYSSLINIPDYAIRLDNPNVWESSSGYNKLNHTIEVW